MSKSEVTYYQLPKRLFHEDYKEISPEAKVLYAIMLERYFLSAKNGWLTEEGNPYFFYPIRELAELLCVSKQKVSSMLKELEVNFLIQRKKQGLGKPDVILLFYFECASNVVKRLKSEDTPIKKNIPKCLEPSPEAKRIRELLKKYY